MPDTPRPQTTIKHTFMIDLEASREIWALFPSGRGGGAYCSKLIKEHKSRRELAEQYAKVAAEEQWAQDGICVD